MSPMGSGSPALPLCGQFKLLGESVSKHPTQGPGKNELDHFPSLSQFVPDGDENDESSSGGSGHQLMIPQRPEI